MSSQELLTKLSERPWIQGRAAQLLLSSDVQPAEEIVRNLVWLISGMKSGIQGGIPKSYPQPLSTILEIWFRRIREAGWSIYIGHASEQHVPLWSGDMMVFLSQSDNSRFTLTEDREDPKKLLVTLV